MRSTAKATRKPLTKKELAAAYRRRQAQEKRTELTELVALAYELGRKTTTQAPIPPTRLLAQLREIRQCRAAAKTSKRAAAYLALLEQTTTPAAQEPRAALTQAKPLPTLQRHLDRLLNATDTKTA